MEPFKNLLGYKAAQKIANQLGAHDKSFSAKVFLKNLKKELEPLELKQRMELLTDRLEEQLPSKPSSFKILVKTLNDPKKNPSGLKGFILWPHTNFVARHGLQNKTAAMSALKEMTKVFTAEFAVRPFFINDQKYMLDLFEKWSKDKNEHVRRLVSEGSRPSLPWGVKLPNFLADPTLTWPLLELLENDKSKYVQKSVANHINDLSKQNADFVVEKLKNWPNPWVQKHALRTLIKQGHPGALKLVGVEPVLPSYKAYKLNTKKIKLGQAVVGEVVLSNKTSKSMKVIVDVDMHLLKANGSLSAKVFKGKKLELEPGESSRVSISTPLKKVTTRKYYKGNQAWSLIINGQKLKKHIFHLSV